MRQFLGNQFDFNDRNDFVRNTFNGSRPNPRPTAAGGALAFANVNASPSQGSSLAELGPLLLKATDQDTSDADGPLPLFAIAVAQKLCFFANSGACSRATPSSGASSPTSRAAASTS